VALYVIDEIGKIECLSPEFVQVVRALRSRGLALLATVGLKGEGLIDEVKYDPRAQITRLSHANRDRVPAEIAGALNRWFDSDACPHPRESSG